MALKFDLKNIERMTDSDTVLRWMKCMLECDSRIKAAGMSEMIIKRRLSILKELVCELRLTILVVFVPSEKNEVE